MQKESMKPTWPAALRTSDASSPVAGAGSKTIAMVVDLFPAG